MWFIGEGGPCALCVPEDSDMEEGLLSSWAHVALAS